MTDDQLPASETTDLEDAEVEESRDGGDADAAGTVAEREAVARGDDELFGSDDSDDAGDADDDGAGS